MTKHSRLSSPDPTSCVREDWAVLAERGRGLRDRQQAGEQRGRGRGAAAAAPHHRHPGPARHRLPPLLHRGPHRHQHHRRPVPAAGGADSLRPPARPHGGRGSVRRQRPGADQHGAAAEAQRDDAVSVNLDLDTTTTTTCQIRNVSQPRDLSWHPPPWHVVQIHVQSAALRDTRAPAVWYLYLEKLARHGSDRYSCDADLFQIFLYYNLDSVQTGVRSRHRRKTETKLPQNFTKKHFRDLSKHYNFICMYRKYIFYFITWRIHLTFNNRILVNSKTF